MDQPDRKASFEQFLGSVDTGRAVITVIGLGRTGLPEALAFSSSGFRVLAFDTSRSVLRAIERLECPFREPDLKETLRDVSRKGLFKPIEDRTSSLKGSRVVLVCVPTSLDKTGRPDLGPLEETVRAVGQSLSRGELVIIGSTLPPGTTKRMLVPILEDSSGLVAGSDFWLAYCPERLAPGRALKEFVENNRIIGGINGESAEAAAYLYGKVVKGPIKTMDCTTVEVAKLAENTFRSVNIAFANELALVCEHVGVDVKAVIRLANTHPRVKIHNPGAGVGGPCLTKDPHFLLRSTRSRRSLASPIGAALEMNSEMPTHAVALTVSALEAAGERVKGARIAVLGTAYKGDVDDSRESPSELIISGLKDLGAQVVAYDPMCVETFGARRAGSLRDALRAASAVVIATDHSEFKASVLPELRSLGRASLILVDCRRIIRADVAEKLGVRYYGIGRGNG